MAVLATLLGEYGVEPVPQPGESMDEAREQVQVMLDDSAISAITLQIREPGKVGLRWIPLE